MNLEAGYSITSISDSLSSEADTRKRLSEGTVRFGISFLDQNFVGMVPGDIILLGAKTGIGKSTLLSILAENCVKANKRVVLYALEARENEVVHKMKYFRLLQEYYDDPNREYCSPRFPLWIDGQLDSVFAKYEDKVNSELNELKNLKIVTRNKNFGLKEFLKSFLALQHETDVFIVDHVHYFDTEGLNENRELTEITKEIRNLALVFNKIIILAAHTRKKTNFDTSIIPSLDDFHGSSNLTKIATKVILFAPYPDLDQKDKALLGTLMSLAKFRDDGGVSRYCGLVWMSLKTGRYINPFYAGVLSHEKGKQVWTRIENEKILPKYLISPP